MLIAKYKKHVINDVEVEDRKAMAGRAVVGTLLFFIVIVALKYLPIYLV